jgi:hypothetical protein
LDKLYLNIPFETRKGEKYENLEWLNEFTTNKTITTTKIILHRSPDYGSITKLLPTLDAISDPYAIIITFDDDVQCSQDVVKNLVEGVVKHKFQAAVGLGGWVAGKFPFMYQSVHDKEREVDWLEGKTAVAYPRHLLPSTGIDLLVHPFPPHLAQHDDHIITYHVAKRGGKRFVVDGRNAMKERMNIRGLDSISGNAMKYLSQVKEVVKIMKQEELYNQSTDCTQTYGFTIIVIIIIIIIVFILFYYATRKS